jgi:hypothetical protein
MNAPEENASLFFTDGHVINRNAILVAGQLNAYPEADFSRLVFLLNGEWLHRDVEDDMIRSVTFNPAVQQCYFMGRNGTIISAGNGRPFNERNMTGTFREEHISDTETYGELFRIRSICGSVYACGQSSQIYKLQRGIWTHFDQGILREDGETLEDIDGAAPDDIYAVGLSGTIAHYDGKAWTLLDSPTNQHFSNVRCASRNEVYLCGNNGMVFRGRRDNWQFIGSPDLTSTFWGMEMFHDELYLAHHEGIMKYDGNSIVPVSTGEKKFTFHRLHSNDEILVSFGVDDIVIFDGGAIWSEMVFPDNV